jgi:hypothetical protein
VIDEMISKHLDFVPSFETSATLDRDQTIQLSIAISLKRIADALDGTAAGVDISESLCGGRPDKFRYT